MHLMQPRSPFFQRHVELSILSQACQEGIPRNADCAGATPTPSPFPRLSCVILQGIRGVRGHILRKVLLVRPVLVPVGFQARTKLGLARSAVI